MKYNMNLKNIRTNNNLNQTDIAKILKIARVTYTHYETQENIIPIKHLIVLANYFNVSIDYLLGLTNTITKIEKDINLNKCSIRLKEFRKSHKLTQTKLADFLKIDQPTWSIYEKGKSLIGTPFLYMICEKYNISADYLLGRTDTPKYLKAK